MSAVRVLEPRLYERFKDKVLELSNAVQGDKPRGLSVEEIAERLGLSVEDALEILSVAEKDLPLEEWFKADEFKERRRPRA